MERRLAAGVSVSKEHRRFADMYNIVYMTFKAIHMLIAKSSSLQTDRQNIIVDGTTSRLPEEVLPPLHADVLTQ